MAHSLTSRGKAGHHTPFLLLVEYHICKAQTSEWVSLQIDLPNSLKILYIIHVSSKVKPSGISFHKRLEQNV